MQSWVRIYSTGARVNCLNLLPHGVLTTYNDVLTISNLRTSLQKRERIGVGNVTRNDTYETEHTVSDRQVEIVLEGGLINVVRNRQKGSDGPARFQNPNP
jgi:hypothetical protein